MNPEAQEDDLVQRATAGEQAALQRLLLRHHDRLCTGLAPRLPAALRGVIAVDDIVQEVYVVVFQEIQAFVPRGPRSFFGWLSRIAERKLLDAVKAATAAKRGGGRAKVQPAKPGGASVVEWLEVLAGHERTPSRSVARHEAVEAVRGALAGLKVDYREALRLRYVEGLPVAAAAARMNRTPGALCQLCHRGLRELEQALGGASRYLSSTE